MWVRNNKGNVFVGNLPPDFSDERLAEAFDPYGIVLSASVARDPETGARLRYGFVDIATEKAANQAIGALDGTEIDGCKLNVKASEKKQGKSGKGNGAKRPPGAGARRPPFRSAPPRRTPIGAADMPAPRRPFPPVIENLDRPEPSERPARAARPAQSSIIAAELGEMEPPPRRDFEVVHKPARRRTTPSFQVERRALPRRGQT
jgi:cold-inducible RNA-binding protein